MRTRLESALVGVLAAVAAGLLMLSPLGAQTATRMFATKSADLASGQGTPITCTASGTGCYLDVTIAAGSFTQLVGPAADNTAAPPFSFLGDLTSGFGSSAVGTVNLVTAGTTRFSINSTAGTFTVPAYLPNGTAAAPSLAVASETNSGRYRIGSNNIGESINGVLVYDWNASRVNLGVGQLLQFNGQQTLDGTTTADTWDLIHGTTAQTLRLWGSKTDATHGNYLRFLGGTTSADLQTVRLNVVDPQTNLRLGTSGGGITFTLDGTTGKLSILNGITVDASGASSAALTVGGPSQRKVAATNAQTIGSYTVGAADGTFEVSANINVTVATAHNFSVTCTYTDETNVSRVLTFGFTQLSGATFITAITQITGTGPYEAPVLTIVAKAGTTITTATTGTFTTVTYNGVGPIKQIS